MFRVLVCLCMALAAASGQTRGLQQATDEDRPDSQADIAELVVPVTLEGFGSLDEERNAQYVEEAFDASKIVRCSGKGFFTGLKVYAMVAGDFTNTFVSGLELQCTTTLTIDGEEMPDGYVMGATHKYDKYIFDYTGLNGCHPNQAIGALDQPQQSSVRRSGQPQLWGLAAWCFERTASANIGDPFFPMPAHHPWPGRGPPRSPADRLDDLRCPLDGDGHATGISAIHVLYVPGATVRGLQVAECRTLTLAPPPENPVPVQDLGPISFMPPLPPGGPRGPPPVEPDDGSRGSLVVVDVRYSMEHASGSWEGVDGEVVAFAIRDAIVDDPRQTQPGGPCTLDGWKVTQTSSRRLLQDGGAMLEFDLALSMVIMRDQQDVDRTRTFLEGPFLEKLKVFLEAAGVDIRRAVVVGDPNVEASGSGDSGLPTEVVAGVIGGLVCAALLVCLLVLLLWRRRVRKAKQEKALRAKAESFTRIVKKHITPAPSQTLGKEVSQFRMGSAVTHIDARPASRAWSDGLNTIDSHSTHAHGSAGTTQRNNRNRMHSDMHPTMRQVKDEDGMDRSHTAASNAIRVESDSPSEAQMLAVIGPSSGSSTEEHPRMAAMEAWAVEMRSTGRPLSGKYVLQGIASKSSTTLVCRACNQMNGDLLAAVFHLDRATYEREHDFYSQQVAKEHVPVFYDALPGRSQSGVQHPSDLSAHAPCLMLEWGTRSLAQMLQPGRSRLLQDSLELKIILNRLALALNALHRSDVVHMAVQPANMVWFSSEASMFTWKLVDFSKWAVSGQPTAVSTELRYAAPEVVQVSLSGQTTIPADPAIDMWAFGILCYEVFAQRRMFSPATSRAEIEAMLGGELPLPHEASPSFMEAITDIPARRIVEGLLRRDPATRWTAARVLASPPFLTKAVDTPHMLQPPTSLPTPLNFSSVAAPATKLRRMTLHQVTSNPAGAVLTSLQLSARGPAPAPGSPPSPGVSPELSDESFKSGVSELRDPSFASDPAGAGSRRTSTSAPPAAVQVPVPCVPPTSLCEREEPVFYLLEATGAAVKLDLCRERAADLPLPALKLLAVQAQPVSGGVPVSLVLLGSKKSDAFSCSLSASWPAGAAIVPPEAVAAGEPTQLRLSFLYQAEGEEQPMLVAQVIRVMVGRYQGPEEAQTTPAIAAGVPEWAAEAATAASCFVFMP